MWGNHIVFGADKAAEIAERYGANKEKVVTGFLLHDLADVWMDRSDEKHEEKGQNKARKILNDSGFSEEEAEDIINNVINPHSCYPDNMPTTPEGRIVATADALTHLETDFFKVMETMLVKFGINKTPQEYKEWVKEKLKKDFESKIFFDEIREEVRATYEKLLVIYQ